MPPKRNQNTNKDDDNNDADSVASTSTSATTANVRSSKRQRKSVANTSNDLDDSNVVNNNEHEISNLRTAKRSRSSTANPSQMNSSAELDDSMIERSTRTRGVSAQNNSRTDLIFYLEDFFDIFCSYQDETQRYLAIVFYTLPSPKEYPDYYEIIKNPIDLKQIAKKVLTSTYTTIKQMEADLTLMLDNAKRYNEPKSIIYKDATKLKKLTMEKAKELSSLLKQNKLYQNSKNREKKIKLLQEISESGPEEINDLIMNNLSNNKEHQSQKEVEESDESEVDEEEDEGDEDSNESDDEDAEGAAAPKKRGRKPKIKPQIGEESPTVLSRRTKNNPLIMAMWELFDFIKEYKLKNQPIIDPFVKLPSKVMYPDYYQEIKNPIALNTIKVKITKKVYKNFDELVADFKLLFTNALNYNLEESLIYQHAKLFLEALKTKANELGASVANLSIDTTNIPNYTPSTPGRKSKAHQQNSATKQPKHVVEHNIKRLFKLVLDYCGGEEESKDANTKQSEKARLNPNKTILSQQFMTLPNRSELPGYYEKIREPLDFDTVQKRVDSGSYYNSEADVVTDCNKVLNNARSYFPESSLIHKDAVKLQAYLENRYQQFMQRQHINMSELTALSDDAMLIDAKLPKFTDLKDKLTYLYKYIDEFRLEGRELAPPFKHLPSRTEYPDYYNVIKKPIDMHKIWNRLSKFDSVNAYSSIDEMCCDFGQMFENACIYNEPSSTLYKDALTLQRALFTRVEDLLEHEERQNGQKLSELDDSLPRDFVQTQIQDLIGQLFESTIQYQDVEGRLLSECFLELHNLQIQENKLNFLTFDIIKQRIKQKYYPRLDMFQEDMFELFNQIRFNSYFELDSNNFDYTKYKHKIHRYSQLYKDAYELQRYFIQKRDELCKNGELLMSGSLSYKLSSLDSNISNIIGANTQAFDESEALLVEQRFKPLEGTLNNGQDKASAKMQNVNCGDFYYINRNHLKSQLDQYQLGEVDLREDFIICVLKSSQNGSKFIAQVYLRPRDDQFIHKDVKFMRKFYSKEVLKSDLYAVIDLNQIDDEHLRPCYVMSMKDFINSELNFDVKRDLEDDEMSVLEIKREDVFICESMYSTHFRYFRKIMYKKWCPLSFVNVSSNNSQTRYNFTQQKRHTPLLIQRSYLDETLIEDLRARLQQVYDLSPLLLNKKPDLEQFYRIVQYDSPPAAALQASKEKDADEIDANAACEHEDPELMKHAKYYEQLIYQNEVFKLGDFVYIRQQVDLRNHSNLPNIVRIDRLWSIKTLDPATNQEIKLYHFRGPLFLRACEVKHEPTRLFYKNEVVKEISRQISANLDQICESDLNTGSKKCVVMNAKAFSSSRLTELDELDTYICEQKYSLINKTFRKGTKGLKKFELSGKCTEDEVWFLRKELQLRKQLSPLLVNMDINYDEEETKSDSNHLGGLNEDTNMDDDDWDDENSSHSFQPNMNENSTMDGLCFSTQSPGMKNIRQMSTTALMGAFQNIGSPSVLASASNTNTTNSSKKMRVKREKKSGYNIFSREFRRKLRETNSSLPFKDMGKEVGRRWSALSDQEKAAYEEQAKIESLMEAEKRAEERKIMEEQNKIQQQQVATQQQQQQQQQTPVHNQQYITQHPTQINNIYAVQQQQQQNIQPVMFKQAVQVQQQQPLQQQQQPQLILYQNGNQVQQLIQQPQLIQQQPIVQQQTQIIYEQAQPVVVQPEGPRTVQHKEAYLKYIANLKKQQQMYQSRGYLSQSNYMSQIHNMEWYKSLDVNPARIRESRVMMNLNEQQKQQPNAWIDNCSTDDLYKELTKLRYYLVCDSISIDSHPIMDEHEAAAIANSENGDVENRQLVA